MIVFDNVVGAREAQVLNRIDINVVVGTTHNDFGDVVTVNLEVGSVNNHLRGPVRNAHLDVGVVDRESPGTVRILVGAC